MADEAVAMAIRVREVMGKNADTARTKHLAEILQVPLEWRINNLSDGQRRRCQLLEILATPRPVYLMDEITSDLDLYARDGVLKFLKTETETRGPESRSRRIFPNSRMYFRDEDCKDQDGLEIQWIWNT